MKRAQKRAPKRQTASDAFDPYAVRRTEAPAWKALSEIVNILAPFNDDVAGRILTAVREYRGL